MRKHQPAALAVALTTALLALAGCGGHKHVTPPTPTPPASCTQASGGHGSMGICAPKRKLGLAVPRPHAFGAFGLPTYPDLSNNDPCVCGANLRGQGYVGLIVKANQGTGFVDGWAVAMVQSARAAGLAVGMYDFDQDYTVAEAQLFVSRLHAAGIYPNTPNAFPAYLDVEYGNFSYGGLLAQIAYLRSQGYRVGIYTGDWYWAPNAGCQWPSGVTAWLSGYPNAPVPCGTTGYNAHQFTSSPIDLTVFLGSFDQFHAFVNAGPPPDPYAMYPTTVFGLTFGQHASEHNTVSTWDAAKCRNPVRRAVCKSTRWHIELLRDREWFVAHHRPLRGRWVAVSRPRWGDAHLGARFQGLSHRLTAR